jgi:muramoyltetrapeptide carboxypeptidase
MQFNFPKLPELPLNVTTVGLSGSVDPAQLQSGVARFTEHGHSVSLPDAAFVQWRYFAGDDDARLAALNAVLAGDEAVVLMSRGGYGLSRLLHRIDWHAVAATQKVFCGYSDVTAFSLAALARANFVTYAGPLLIDVVPNADDPTIAEFSLSQFVSALTDRTHRYDVCTSDRDHGKQIIEGTLWGTNLAMVAHLVGTLYMPVIDDGILVIEDIAESPYRIERMLWQLKHAGILDRQRAIVLGEFTACDPSQGLRYPYSMNEAIETLRKMVVCPVLTGFPFGHVSRKVTIPMGGRATIQIDGNLYEIRLLGR